MSEPGWLDFEFGGQRSKGGGDKTRDSMPVTAKLAFNSDWGLVLGSELGIRRTDLGGKTFNGAGDVTALVKHRWATASEDMAWGAMAGVKLPTANDDVGSGKTDLILTGIFSKDFSGSNHLDINLGVTRLGAYGPGEGRMQYGWAAALSHGLNDQWSLFAEPSGTYRHAVPSTAQLMLGASYAYTRRTVFDVALARGLTSATPHWQLQAGVTVLLARLW